MMVILCRMFYFFFESRNNRTTDPVVLWMTGGPGCASELALFYENGPFKIANDLSLVWNDFGWDKVSSIIFVDQPIGTGFSYSTDVRDLRHDEAGVSEDMYDFFQVIFPAGIVRENGGQITYTTKPKSSRYCF
jgi:serine carboxypeptidase-like clade 4